jgi:hypothetical protein
MARVWWLLLLVACKSPGDTGDTDVDTDGPVDTDDTDVDTDPPEEPWTWCPSATDAVTGAWDASLHSTGDLWCAMASEGYELADEPARKAQILVVAGDYALPDVAVTDDPYRLPVCTLLADGTHVDLAGTGTIYAYAQPYGDATSWQWRMDQPMTRDGAPWSMQLWASDETDDPSPEVTMGPQATLPWGGPHISVSLNEGTYPTYSSWREFVPCAYADPPRIDTTHVEFEGGEAELVLNVGQSPASTEPAMFVRATGTLDGVSFDVTDYWQLVYNPEHHHFQRHFAVVFDEPIGDACGLVVRDVDAYYSDDYGAPAIIETADCELVANGMRANLAQTTDRVSTY